MSRNLKTMLAVALPTALLASAGAGVLIARATDDAPDLPGAIAVGDKDPGVAACEYMRDNIERLAAGSGTAGAGATVDQKALVEAFQQARARLGASRYPAIRDNGIKVAEVYLRGMNTRDQQTPQEAMAIVVELRDAYNGLLAGCAEACVRMPAVADVYNQAR
jgi:hypothetical protein